MRELRRKEIAMANKVAVAKRYTEVTIGSLLEEVQTAVDRIRRRAYELAAERGFAAGHDLDDWLKAENELFFVPACEIEETETEYNLKASVPGFSPDQIAVCVEPQSVTVWGKTAMSGEVLGEAGTGSDVGGKEMFCQYRLPQEVEAERAKAFCDAEELIVTLPKRSEPFEADTEQPAAA